MKASNTNVDGDQIIVAGTEEDTLTRNLEAARALYATGNTERAEEPHWAPVMGIIEEPDPVETDGRNAT